MTQHEPGSLRFAANLKWLFTELPFEQRFDAAAEAGFTGVEFASPYEYPAELIARRLRDAGLQQVLINSPMGPSGSVSQRGFACLPGLRNEFRESVNRALEYAAALDCQLVHVVAGVTPDGTSHDRAFAQYVHNISWAADAAAASAVTLVLEYQNSHDVPGFLLESQDQAAAVVEAVESERVGLLFDVYHAQINGDATETLTRLLPLVRHIQVADVPGRHEPGTGELDWRHLLRLIAQSPYTGWIGCEYGPTADTKSGLGWIEELTA